MAYALGAIGSIIVIFNWYSRYIAWFAIPKLSVEEQEKRLGTPFIPIIGGLFVFLAIKPLAIPFWLLLLPFVIDYGCFLGILSFIIALCKGAFR